MPLSSDFHKIKMTYNYKRLKQLRKKHGYKQGEIASQALGCSRTNYNKLEKDPKYKMPIQRLQKLAAFYGISLTEFFNIKYEEEENKQEKIKQEKIKQIIPLVPLIL